MKTTCGTKVILYLAILTKKDAQTKQTQILKLSELTTMNDVYNIVCIWQAAVILCNLLIALSQVCWKVTQSDNTLLAVKSQFFRSAWNNMIIVPGDGRVTCCRVSTGDWLRHDITAKHGERKGTNEYQRTLRPKSFFTNTNKCIT